MRSDGTAPESKPSNPTIVEELERVFSASATEEIHKAASLSSPAKTMSEEATGQPPQGTGLPPTDPSLPFDPASQLQIQQITQLVGKIEGQRLSRSDLAQLLDGFARVLRGDHDSPSPESEELSGLRRLLIEAQEMIIKLLADQVKDRSQLAKLETELKFLPDLQAQADRVMAMVNNADSFRDELASVRFELDKFRRDRMRTDMYKPRRVRSWWSWVCGRVLSPPD